MVAEPKTLGIRLAICRSRVQMRSQVDYWKVVYGVGMQDEAPTNIQSASACWAVPRHGHGDFKL